MSTDEFIAARKDQSVSFPNCDDNQCMTLAHKYVEEVLGLTDPLILAQPLAREVFENFDNVFGHDYFQKVENTPTGVPEKGDLVVWNGNEGEGDGHIAIFLTGDANSFTSFDCNWPPGSLPHEQLHDYNNVIGWLHPLPQEPVEGDKPVDPTPVTPPEETAPPEEATPTEAPNPNGSIYTLPSGGTLDLANPESMIECAKVWDRVVNLQEFVDKSEYNTATQKISELEGQLATANQEATGAKEQLATTLASQPTTPAIEHIPTINAIWNEFKAIYEKIKEAEANVQAQPPEEPAPDGQPQTQE